MAYGLSFSSEFFYGESMEEALTYSSRPTSLLQAIVSMTDEEKLYVAKYAYRMPKYKAKVFVHSEEFAYRVLDSAKECNTCSDLSSPVRVYLHNRSKNCIPLEAPSVLVYDP